jgi:hypothetical protein
MNGGAMLEKSITVAADHGYIGDVIMPHATGRRTAQVLLMLQGKTVEMLGLKHNNLQV